MIYGCMINLNNTATEQALGADSPGAGFFVKLRGRAAQAKRYAALLLCEKRTLWKAILLNLMS
jgi:hypothetical protein